MMNSFSDRSNWIWLAEAPTENCYAEFLCRFSVDTIDQTILYLSAEGQYAAFLNGVHIPSTQYSDFPHYKSLQRADVTKLLIPEENWLIIQVWYPGRDTSVSRREPPGVRFEVRQASHILCASGDATQARPLAGYTQGAIFDITPQLGAGFCHTPAAAEAWERVVVMKKEAQTIPRPIPELRLLNSAPVRIVSQGSFYLSGGATPGEKQQYAWLRFQPWEELTAAPKHLPDPAGIPLKTTTDGNGIYLLLDMGSIQEGYLVLDVVSPAPMMIDVGFGEHVKDLRVRTSIGNRCFTVTCGAIPARQRFVHWFRRLGCRYLQLFLYGSEATIFEASLLPVVYPVDERPAWYCGDALHEKIYDVSRKTLLTCMHEHYEDCPWREQALYGFDARNQMLAGYYAFGEFTLPMESLRLLALSQRTDGLLELCAPARVPVNIPSFSLAFVVALEEYCRYSGDLDFSREMFPVACRIVENLQEHIRDGLAWNYQEPGYWNFYEWNPLLDGMPLDRREMLLPSADAGLQLFGLLAVQRLEKLSEYLDLPVALRDVRESLQIGLEQFWNDEESAYASFLKDGKPVQYSELIQSLALYANAVPEHRANNLRRGLLEKRWLPVTLSYSIFKYEALLQDPDQYGAKVFQEISQRWGRMVFQGAESFWETEEGEEAFDGAGSLCHGWSGIPAYFYGAYALGVQPVRPGVWRPLGRIDSGISNMQGTLVTPEGLLKIGNTPGRKAETWFCLQKNGEKIYF